MTSLGDPYSQQYYKQFRGDLESNGLFRVGFQYDKSNLSTLRLEAPGRCLTSELQDHLVPPLHSELKDILRETYDVKEDAELMGKNIVVEIKPTGYTINRVEQLHPDIHDELIPLDVSDRVAGRIYGFALTLIKYHGAFEAAVINIAYTLGDHVVRKEYEGKQVEGYQ
jgi:hypothetical protein